MSQSSTRYKNQDLEDMAHNMRLPNDQNSDIQVTRVKEEYVTEKHGKDKTLYSYYKLDPNQQDLDNY